MPVTLAQAGFQSRIRIWIPVSGGVTGRGVGGPNG